MSDIYIELIEYICFGLSAAFLIASVVLFFRLHIPEVIKGLRGTVEQKQIEKIRDKSSEAAKRNSAMNVFEELERKAKPRINNTKRIKMPGTTQEFSTDSSLSTERGTTVLKRRKNSDNDFVIEKNMVFVSTADILR